MIELNKVYHQDCLIGMQDIPDKSVDMILCDLPYGTTACKWDAIIPFNPLWGQYERIIKNNAAIALTASQPFTSALVMSNPKWFRHSWVWHKDKSGNFMNAKQEPMKVHEDVLIFGQHKVFFQAIMEMRIEANKRINKPRTNTSNIISTKAFFTEESRGNDEHKNPTSVKYINSVRNGLHPTQKPVALFEYLIKTYTNEGETVLDNCMGSGTTAIACINTGRNYIGFEKEEKYYNIIHERIKKHIGLFAA